MEYRHQLKSLRQLSMLLIRIEQTENMTEKIPRLIKTDRYRRSKSRKKSSSRYSTVNLFFELCAALFAMNKTKPQLSYVRGNLIQFHITMTLEWLAAVPHFSAVFLSCPGVV